MKNDSLPFNMLLFYFISLLVLTVSGLLFKVAFVVYNYSQFSSLPISDIVYALFWGLRFDLASAAVFSLISCLVLWFYFRLQKFKLLPQGNLAGLLLALMLLLQASLQIGDTLYYVDSGRHVSYEMRDVMTDASGLFLTAISHHAWFISLAYLLAFVFIFVVLRLGKNYLSAPLGDSAAAVSSSYGSVSHISILVKLKNNIEIKLLLVLLLSLVFIRGGITGLPQNVTSAFKIGDSKQAVISMNGAYSVVYGVINSSKEIRRLPVTLPTGVDVETVMSTLYPDVPVSAPVNVTQLKKYNLIFILMEGWPADIMSAYGYDKDTTPFFKSLKEKSYAPSGVVAGGNRTTEGIYATFCSQQNPLGATVAQSSLQNNQYRCLPDILKEYGWHTAFFQGTHKETSGTGAFAQSLGFSESFAKEDMPVGRYKHNFWGAHDPDIYDFLLDKLDQMPQPFLVGVNTNSTHSTEAPEGEGYYFGDANHHQKYLSILHFADKSMREFFDKVKTKPYYRNTVFVLMSDHTTGGKRSSVAAKYYIPGIIYSEGIVPAGQVHHYVSQRDFSPTVLDIIGLPASTSFAGKSFWQKNQSAGGDEYFADYFDAGTIGWLEQDSLDRNLLVETSIDDPSRMKCYRVPSRLSEAKPVDCDNRFRENSIKSLVFTSYSQGLLFSGKTKSFFEFADK